MAQDRMSELMQARRAKKVRKPVFKQQDCHKKARLDEGWRRPKGIQSKVRLNKRGARRSPRQGWGSPLAVRGLTRDGLQPKTVRSPADVEALDPQTDGAIIGGGVGLRKRVTLLQQLQQKQVTILNVKDPSAYIEQINASLKERKQEKESRTQKKEKREQEAEKKRQEEEQSSSEENSAEESGQDELAEKVEESSTSGEGQKPQATEAQETGEEAAQDTGEQPQEDEQAESAEAPESQKDESESR